LRKRAEQSLSTIRSGLLRQPHGPTHCEIERSARKFRVSLKQVGRYAFRKVAHWTFMLAQNADAAQPRTIIAEMWAPKFGLHLAKPSGITMKNNKSDVNKKILVQVCRNLKIIVIFQIFAFLIIFLYFLNSSLFTSIIPHYGLIFSVCALFGTVYLGKIVANLNEMIFELDQKDKHSREMHFDT